MEGVPEFTENVWGTTRVVRVCERKAASSLKKLVKIIYKYGFTENGWGTTRVYGKWMGYHTCWRDRDIARTQDLHRRLKMLANTQIPLKIHPPPFLPWRCRGGAVAVPWRGGAPLRPQRGG